MFFSRKERQWSNDPDVLTHHPKYLTDHFVLYIKSSLLASKVKKFICRQHALVLRMSTDTSANRFGDLRETTEFREVDTLVDSFIINFPKTLTLSWRGDAAEVHLFLAILVPHVCIILLHQPHAEMASPNCPSATRMFLAACSIMELLRSAWKSSARTFMMNASFTMYTLFVSGKVMVMFLEAAKQGYKTIAEENCRATVAFIMSALGEIGERTPLARRYAKVLQNQLDSTYSLGDAEVSQA